MRKNEIDGLDIGVYTRGNMGADTDSLPYAMDMALSFAPPSDDDDDDGEENPNSGRGPSGKKCLVAVTYDADGLTRIQQVARELMISSQLKKYQITYKGTGKLASSGDPHRQCIFMSGGPLPNLIQQKIQSDLQKKLNDPGISIEVRPIRYNK